MLGAHMETTRAKAPLDRRVRRTRAAIKGSYLTLCRQKPAGQITVKEIMSLANVNRATFYAHFANLEELGAAIELDAAESIAARCEKALLGSPVECAEDAARVVCDVVMEDTEELARVVLPSATGSGKALLRDRAWTRWGANISGTAAPGASIAGVGFGESAASTGDELMFDLLFEGCVGVTAQWLAEPENINPDQVKATICTAVQKLAE